MDAVDRRTLIESYGRAAADLDAARRAFPSAAWHYRSAPDQWTAHEIIIHLADSEANSYVRARRFIAEPGADLLAYDEVVWAQRLDYSAHSVEAAVELFRLLRRSTYQLIRSLPERVWAQTARHPENGWMTLDDWLTVYERHVRDHVAQMRLGQTAWERAGRPA